MKPNELAGERSQRSLARSPSRTRLTAAKRLAPGTVSLELEPNQSGPLEPSACLEGQCWGSESEAAAGPAGWAHGAGWLLPPVPYRSRDRGTDHGYADPDNQRKGSRGQCALCRQGLTPASARRAAYDGWEADEGGRLLADRLPGSWSGRRDAAPPVPLRGTLALAAKALAACRLRQRQRPRKPLLPAGRRRALEAAYLPRQQPQRGPRHALSQRP